MQTAETALAAAEISHWAEASQRRIHMLVLIFINHPANLFLHGSADSKRMLL